MSTPSPGSHLPGSSSALTPAERFAERTYPLLERLGPEAALAGLGGAWLALLLDWAWPLTWLFLVLGGAGLAALGFARVLSFRPVAGALGILSGVAVIVTAIVFLAHTGPR